MSCSDEQAMRARPFTVPEAVNAARFVWQSAGVPFDVARVGIAMDLRPGALSPSRHGLAKVLGLSVDEVRIAEAIWAMLPEPRRMQAVRGAVNYIRSERARYQRIASVHRVARGIRCRG